MNYNDRKDARTVEAEGFRDGTQGVAPAIAVKEIEAQFARRQEQENQASAEQIKSLEGQVETLQRRTEDAQRRWSDLELKTEGMPPQILLPLCAVVFAIAAVVGEAVFLAPVMDGFGIADLTFQLIFAAVIVITTSGLFEITKKLLHRRSSKDGAETTRSDTEPRHSRGAGGLVFFVALTALAFMLVLTLGWWRAEEMIYAAASQSGTWKDFLTNTPALTRVVVVLLTTCLPLFVAMAFEWGIDGLHLAWEWRKARGAYRRDAKRLDETRKGLEREVETKESRKQVLVQMGEEWKQAYLQNHELGQKTGAWQTPLWRVVLKIGAVVLLVLVVCLALDPITATYIQSGVMRCVLYACLTLGLGVLYASLAIKAWDRPSAAQLYEQKATMFRREEPPVAARALPLPAASTANGNGTRPTEQAQSPAFR